jgi:hypothetical protein
MFYGSYFVVINITIDLYCCVTNSKAVFSQNSVIQMSYKFDIIFDNIMIVRNLLELEFNLRMGT